MIPSVGMNPNLFGRIFPNNEFVEGILTDVSNRIQIFSAVGGRFLYPPSPKQHRKV
jgi:hypothetical protein